MIRTVAGRAVAAAALTLGLMATSAVTAACQAESSSGSAAESTQAPRTGGEPSPAADAPAPSTPAGPAAAPADGRPYCGASRYVEQITVRQWSNGDFRVSLRPTDDARQAGDRTEAASVMWQAIRRCLTTSAGFTGLDGPVGASLQDQLRCHEYLALVPGRGGERYATGETFDIESWRPVAGQSHWFSTKCGNTLGTDPSGGSRTFRPDGVEPGPAVTGEHE